jgi:threonine dehydrogenase-like Zn-dependent dehydrogenase
VVESVRAAVMAGPRKVETRHFPYPRLEDGAMLMKMEMSGICGTDKHSYKGESTLFAGTLRERRIQYPVVPGHENVGIVAEITPKARHELEFYHQELKEGDRVVMCCDYRCGHCYECRNTWGFTWCNNWETYGLTLSCEKPPHLFGGWSEYMYIIPGIYVYKVPDGMPPEVAVLTEPFTCTWGMDRIRDFASQPSEGFCTGDTVVILGLGPNGLLHTAKARMLGAGNIIGIDLSPFRLAMAKQFSADHVINASETTSEERIQMVKDLTQGRGADVVLEAVGNPKVLVEALEMLGNGGVLIEEGAFVDIGSVEINPHRHILAKNARIIGMGTHSFPHYYEAMDMMQRFRDTFPFDRVVTHKFKIEDAEQAILKSMELDSMKVVITP